MTFSTAPMATAQWGYGVLHDRSTSIEVPHRQLPAVMHGARHASGQALVSNGHIGADLIRLAAGARFPVHTHPGHHVLVVVAGHGTPTYNGQVLPTMAGECYLVEGAVPHAVGAITDHLIVAVGAPHRSVDATDRLEVADYCEVLVRHEKITCTICQVTAALPAYLHNTLCTHCPCRKCAQ